jgi:hypothetical protein
VISPTLSSQQHLWDYIEVPPQHLFDSVDPKSVRQTVADIVATITAAKQRYETEEQYREAYQVALEGKSGQLTPHQVQLIEERNGAPPIQVPWPRACLIVDDMSHAKAILDRPWWTNLVLRHRHLEGVGLSIVQIVQTLKGGLPRVIRLNLSFLGFYRTSDQDAVLDLYREVAGRVGKKLFLDMYQQAVDEPHGFLGIDMATSAPNQIFSKSLREHFVIK